jgi:hypothetical protein
MPLDSPELAVPRLALNLFTDKLTIEQRNPTERDDVL